MSKALDSSRLEAFSDGVIAVIITIMVLELKVPGKAVGNVTALRAVTPVLLVYLLSFVQVGIYWVNHHYMIGYVERVSHGILWANLAFLFCLSLFPFATNWVAERGITAFSLALYATASVLPALTWHVLSVVITRFLGITSATSALKKYTSTLLYVGAIPAAYLSPYLSLGMILTVAVLWLVPPRRIAQATRTAGTPSGERDYAAS